ncbi:hypothetical protein EZS27_026177, partial [termite gut metagenome]
DYLVNGIFYNKQLINMNDVYHYPPDLFDLVVQTIPLLNRSKKAVLTFFNGAGVDTSIYTDISLKVGGDVKSMLM